MARYAANTQVPADRSRAEIERILTRYGATSFGYLTMPGRAVVEFILHQRRIRFEIPLPDQSADEFTKTPTGRRRRNTDASLAAWGQATRQRWRALALAIKAKLETVESGIAEFEAEFLAYIVLPDNRTVASHALPTVAEAYRLGRVSHALLALPAAPPDVIDVDTEEA